MWPWRRCRRSEIGRSLKTMRQDRCMNDTRDNVSNYQKERAAFQRRHFKFTYCPASVLLGCACMKCPLKGECVKCNPGNLLGTILGTVPAKGLYAPPFSSASPQPRPSRGQTPRKARFSRVLRSSPAIYTAKSRFANPAATAMRICGQKLNTTTAQTQVACD